MALGYPKYYAVNDRLVTLIVLADGGVDALVFDFVTGRLVPDRSYFERVSDVGIGKDVDSLSEVQFRERLVQLRTELSRQRCNSPLRWESSGDGEFPYRADLGGHLLVIRVNDFPDEPLYTLFIDGHPVDDLEDWPLLWTKPA